MDSRARGLMSTVHLARRLGVSPRTVERWREEGHDGPPWIPIGRRIMYDPVAIDAWLAEQTITPTDDPDTVGGDRP